MIYHRLPDAKTSTDSDLHGWLRFHGVDPKDAYAAEFDSTESVLTIWRYARNAAGARYTVPSQIELGKLTIATAPLFITRVLYLPDLSLWQEGALPVHVKEMGALS